MQYKHILPDSVLGWIIDNVSPNATVKSVKKLPGATSSLIYSIALEVEGASKGFVLRYFNNKEWLQEEPHACLHEAKSLDFAFNAGLPAPQLIAFDATGSKYGTPIILMTQLKGIIQLQPKNINLWLNELAKALSQIHTIKVNKFPWKYFPYRNIKTFPIPSWSNYPKEWEIITNKAKNKAPHFKPRFIHRDYHPANVLWVGAKISGIVDWPSSCLGPAGVDVGHCRVNLAQLYSVSVADDFLIAYLKHAGKDFFYDPYWDIVSLIDILFGSPKVYGGWKEFGVTRLTDKLIAERLDNYMLSLLKRTNIR